MKKFLIIFYIATFLSLLGFCHMTSAEENSIGSKILIKAVNPGYIVDGKSNVGEMIEIVRAKSDQPILLAGATVGYTNSSGNYSILFEFPENSWMTGESILLRLASSPESELAAENYARTLAFKGKITLEFDGEVIDQVCWTGKDDCAREFKSSAPTTLVRNFETNQFEHVVEYKAIYDERAYFVEPEKEDLKPSQCKGLVFNEVLSYYETLKTEQFIEFYNSSSEQILMDGCVIKYKNKFYNLKGILKPEAYYAYYPSEFSLTKNPTNKTVVELVDTDGKILDRLEYPNGQRKGTSFAMIGFNQDGEKLWRTTYAPTPGAANNFQEFKQCEAGKVINKETGNCVKVANITEKLCGEGQYLNLLTGRCRKIESNPAKTCKDGYELNPETGRCRKIKDNTGADYSLIPETFEEKSSFIAFYAVVIVVALGAFYVFFEFRKEIARLFGKVFRRFR